MKIEFKNGFENLINRIIATLRHDAREKIKIKIDDELRLVKEDLMARCAAEIDSIAVEVIRRNDLKGDIVISLSFDEKK